MINIPNHEEHCEHSFKRYGIRGDDIHTWIDEPSQVAGPRHRSFRHNLSTLPIIIKIFGKMYDDKIVENIFFDHIVADNESSLQNRVGTKTKV